MAFRVLNTLSHRVEEVVPLESGVIRLYTCGPTVYRDAHIGNLRSYLMADWLRRGLAAAGYRVDHIKNITDVGHMRQEMVERGEDKVIAAALALGKSPEEIARGYTEAFLRDEEELHILAARAFPRATEHVAEMVRLTEELLAKDHAYEVQGNVYYAVDSFPGYGQLSGNLLESLLEGVRAGVDPLKRDPRDFALWKAAEPGRALSWPSPWGDGFPGWHIECSAMAMKYLGPQIDLHTGGVDNIFPHHEGERAQSEAATGAPFVRTWVHGQHLLADGIKMAKSTRNDYTIRDLAARGFDPLAFRYLCLTARYSTRLNFTFSALRAAEKALARLRHRMWEWSAAEPIEEDGDIDPWSAEFRARVEDNLDLPGALATVWRLLRSPVAGQTKLRLLREFDGVLGLGLDDVSHRYRAPAEVARLVVERRALRDKGRFPQADALRRRIQEMGYAVEDTPEGPRVRPRTNLEKQRERWASVSSSQEIPSLLAAPSEVEFTVVVVGNHREDVRRCLESALSWGQGYSLEALAVDNGATDDTGGWLEELARGDERVRVVHTDHVLGEASARNIGLRQARGEIVVLLDPSVEVTGDIYAPLRGMLAGPQVGVAGPFGLETHDLHDFQELARAEEADAMQGYCFAFLRQALARVGWMPESYRFYRNLDIEYSFRFRDAGYRILSDPDLSLQRHPHRGWLELDEEQRDALSLANFRRFLKRWGHRHDLLVHEAEHDAGHH